MRPWLILLVGCGGAATGDEAPPAKVFVTYDGTLVEKAGADDATSNTSSIFSGTLSAFTGRATDTTTALEAILAPFHIEVVTERPDNALYDMIVIAGTAEEAGLASGLGGAAPFDCQNAVPNKMVFVFGNSFPITTTGAQYASLAVAGLGFSQGIPSSNLKDDCLCWSGAACDNTKQCTFGGPGTPIADNDPCAAGATTMDPMTEFQRVYGLAAP